MRREHGFLLLLLAGFVGGIAVGRAMAPTAAISSASRSGIATGTATPQSGVSAETPDVAGSGTHPPQARRPLAPTPLPPDDASVTGYFDDLAARAKAGDIAAARRLADDFATCANQPNLLDAARHDVLSTGDRRATSAQNEARLTSAEQLLQRHAQTQTRCDGIASLKSSERDWIALAARNGDPEALLCYDLFPNEWYPELLSPDWLAHSAESRANVVAVAQRSYAAGVPEAAAVLSQMYMPPRRVFDPFWMGHFGDDPYHALAYAYVAVATLESGPASGWSIKVTQLEARLTPDRIAEARRWADAQRESIAFHAIPLPQQRQSQCSFLRYKVSR